MAPPDRKRLISPPADLSSFKKSAVLLLLYQKNNKLYFPLIERDEKGIHGGQISLPGGKSENNEELLTTALREAREEINAEAGEIFHLAKLTSLFIPVSRFTVQPFLVFTAEEQHFIRQENEVKTIFEIELDDFLLHFTKQNDNFKTMRGMINAPCLNYRNLKIWGATSMILNEFIMLMK